MRTLLWRVTIWAGLTVATVLAARGFEARLWSGVTIAIAAIAVQFLDLDRPVRVSTTAITVATVFGLASTVLSTHGLGEVPAFVAASRIAFPIDRGWGRIFLVADTVLVGAVIGWVSHSLVGLLAGVGIPVLAQRANERRQLVESRDEARALLVEVQAGREAETQSAALRERGRIARDLHDVLAHSLAGLSLQLQATRAVAARERVGPAVLEPLDRAAMLARDGLAEARAVVGALREPGELGTTEIRALVERHPGEVTLEVVGSGGSVSPQAGHAVYRAVQEALTNAARYAPGSPVTVRLCSDVTGLSVTVDDAGLPVGRSAVAGQGSGLGLAGMDDRIRAAGGTLTAGPRPDGGWQVRVHVPVG